MSLINDFLQSMYMRKGSDLHVIAGDPPRMRVHGDLITLDNQRLDPEELKAELFGIMSPQAIEQFNKTRLGRLGALDPGRRALSRQRVPAPERHRRRVPRHPVEGAVARRAQDAEVDARALDGDARPDPRDRQDGLGQVDDAGGRHRRDQRREKGHILTIEDPIEFVHQRKQCLISQREVGVHSPSFANALHSALREDPDAILVGELRDLETMSIAMTAAEMGVLVMGTLHTNGAAATIDRAVNIFPADKQDHVRNMLSTSLRGIVSQQLVKKKDGTGRCVALEILINTSAAANLIRQGKLEQLENVMQSSGREGMCTMDGSLKKLYDDGLITGEEAYLNAYDKGKFEQIKDA